MAPGDPQRPSWHGFVGAVALSRNIRNLPVMRLPFGQAEPDRQLLRIGNDMDFGREPAA